MAITYTKPVTRYGQGTFELNRIHRIECMERYEGEVAYEGAVIGKTYRTVQIMSDVWEDLPFARIATTAGVMELPLPGGAEVEADVDPALLAQAEAADKRKADEKAAAERAKRAAEMNEHDKAAVLNGFGKGDRVRVYKGRKVPKGTEGEIIWEGHGDYGPRIGIKDDEGTVHWTARSNVERADATELAILANGDWSALRRERARAADAKREAARKAAPVKGTRVRTACGHTGKVFWVAGDGSRVGVRVGKGREDVVWANTNTVAAA